MGTPKEGEFVTIQSCKHDGHLHRAWHDTIVLETSEYSLIGVNNHTLVTEPDGHRRVTREPTIIYFHKKYWFNMIAMTRGRGVSHYCSLAPSYVLDDEALEYIDYDLDIKAFPDGKKRSLGADEYEFHNKLIDHSEDIGSILKENVRTLVDRINNEKGPFSSEYVDIWYQCYQQLSKK